MSDLITLNISGVRGFIDSEGTAHLNLEDCARGLGFTRDKNGTEYVIWDRVEEYLSSFGFHTCVERTESFIPENIFYRLAMKAKNETAERFQALVADEILPAIRKTGSYSARLPKTFAEALRLAADQQEKIENQQLIIAQQDQQIKEMKPKATYYNLVLQSKSLLPISKIAKDYGMSATALNKKLHDLKVQYKMGDTWLLYQKYAGLGYTQSKTHVIDDTRTAFHTYWTHSGRLFIYDLLKANGILPLIER